MSFWVEIGWFLSAEFSSVVAGSDSGSGVAAAVNTLVITFPGVTSSVTKSNGSINVSTNVASLANSDWATGTLLLCGLAAAFAWGDQVDRWTKLSFTLAFVPLTKFVFGAGLQNWSVEIWASGFDSIRDWHVWTLVWDALVFFASFWAFP
jgi:hypothetical protein